MEKLSFIFTICFMLLGPIKIIPAFAQMTRESERPFKRDVAIKGALIASGVCLFVLLAGKTFVGKYALSLEALQIGGGLVLLLAALFTIFPRAESPGAATAKRSSLQIAISLATPVIVPPAGVAALLIFVMSAPRFPGMYQAIAIVVAVIMVMDFLVMLFNDQIMRIPGLLPVLQLLGAILIFMQVALSIETMLGAFKSLGIITH